MKNKKSILFVSRDRGSANALIPVLKALRSQGDLSLQTAAEKYSIKAFKDEGFEIIDLSAERLKMNRPDLIVTGASMLDSLEKKVIRWAGKGGIKTITLLDYWGHYWHRFTISGDKDFNALPDLILVPDESAKAEMIKAAFPKGRLKVTGNPYFDSFIRPKEELPRPVRGILYVSQPVYKDASYHSDILKIKEVIRVIQSIDRDLEMVVKPHPKENPTDFSKLGPGVKIDRGTGVKVLLQAYDLLIGTDSTVLFEAALSGKPVISYQPETERVDTLITNKMGLTLKARNPEELKKILKNLLKREKGNRSIPLIPYLNDGKCTLRVVKIILDHLKKED
jgi:glycosyltransferase involved in cell wall biosynthesis